MNHFIDENCNSSSSNSFLKMNQFICLSQINPNELNANSFKNGNGPCTSANFRIQRHDSSKLLNLSGFKIARAVIMRFHAGTLIRASSNRWIVPHNSRHCLEQVVHVCPADRFGVLGRVPGRQADRAIHIRLRRWWLPQYICVSSCNCLLQPQSTVQNYPQNQMPRLRQN